MSREIPSSPLLSEENSNWPILNIVNDVLKNQNYLKKPEGPMMFLLVSLFPCNYDNSFSLKTNVDIEKIIKRLRVYRSLCEFNGRVTPLLDKLPYAEARGHISIRNMESFPLKKIKKKSKK